MDVKHAMPAARYISSIDMLGKEAFNKIVNVNVSFLTITWIERESCKQILLALLSIKHMLKFGPSKLLLNNPWKSFKLLQVRHLDRGLRKGVTFSFQTKGTPRRHQELIKYWNQRGASERDKRQVDREEELLERECVSNMLYSTDKWSFQKFQIMKWSLLQIKGHINGVSHNRH